jgi:hypothetical protein
MNRLLIRHARLLDAASGLDTATTSSRDRFYIDDWSETAEVCSIEGKQAAKPMLKHCRDDIGVVDLPATAGMCNQ